MISHWTLVVIHHCQINDMVIFIFNFVILQECCIKKINVLIQYFVGIPFAFTIALHRLGMLLIKLCKYSMDKDSHSRLRTSNNSSSFFRLGSVVIPLSLAHKFSMGFKSRGCAGHFITFTLLFARYR